MFFEEVKTKLVKERKTARTEQGRKPWTVTQKLSRTCIVSLCCVHHFNVVYFNQLCNETNWLRTFEFQFSAKFRSAHTSRIQKYPSVKFRRTTEWKKVMIISHDTVERAAQLALYALFFYTLSQFNYPLFFTSKWHQENCQVICYGCVGVCVCVCVFVKASLCVIMVPLKQLRFL